MKKIGYIYIIIISFLLPTLTMAQYQDACIDRNTPANAVCGNWINHSDSIIGYNLHPPFGDCEIDFSYQTRTCTITEGGCTRTFEQLRFTALSWDWKKDTTNTADTCYGFMQFLMPGYPDNFSGIDKNNFEIFLGMLFPKIMNKQYDAYLASLTPAQKLAIKCDGVFPNCEMPPCNRYEISYISSLCKDMCFNLSNPDHPVLLIGECYTGPGCCIVTANYCPCFNDNSELVEAHRVLNVTVDPGTCAGIGQYYGTCLFGTGGNDYIYEPCQIICPNIEQ
ncbi:MAG TPA: hypothetical protein PLE30_06940 [Candidatus Kapabacteria bacterium]|nr:hypothetical protein [Candidatus Kapabacteria bacterium]